MSLLLKTANSRIKISYGLSLFAAYFVAAKLGMLLATVEGHASPLWPASGIALSGLLILGRRYWPFILAGAFAANAFTGIPILPLIAVAGGNTLEAVISQVFFRRFVNERPNTIGIPLITALFSSVLLAAPVASLIAGLALTHDWASFRTIATIWWTGDSIGIFLMVPFALSLFNRDYSTRNWAKAAELTVFVALLAGVGSLVFRASPENTAFVMLIYPVLLLGVARLGAVETSLAVFAVVGFCSWVTYQGRGPFNGSDLGTNLLYLQLFIGSVAMTDLILRYLKRAANLKSSAWVLMVCWVITGLVFHVFIRKEHEVDQTRFETLVNNANAKLMERVLLYETAIRGGVGLFKSTERVEREDWHAFVSELNLEKNFPGFYGLGYILPANDQQLPDLLSKGKREYGDDFEYRQFDYAGRVVSNRSKGEHFIAMAMEPRRPTLRPLGMDLATERDRYDALAYARDTGEITLSKPLKLQNTLLSNGFLILSPVYRDHLPTRTVEERRKAFVAWVHSPLLVDLFFDGIYGAGEREIAMEVTLEDAESGPKVLFSSFNQGAEINHKYRLDTHLKLWGHPVKTSWLRTTHFESRKDNTGAWINFVCILISLLLATLIGVFENLLQEAQKIADQKTRELALRGRLWNSLSRVAPVGIFQLDRGGTLIFANERWCEYTGVDQYRLPYCHWLDAFESSDRAGIEILWQELEGKRIDLIQSKCRFTASSKIFAFSLQAVEDEVGQICHFVGTVQDISEIHARQVQVMQASRLATVGVMAAGMAHEINNPLTIIAGRAQLILRQIDMESVPKNHLKESLVIIKQTVDRIARIVRGLRTFSRGGEGDLFLSASVPQMVTSTLEFCSERFRMGGVELRLRTLPELDLACREVQVCQVLLNLLNNAYDAATAQDARWVELEVQETDTEVRFIVTDSGRGIRPEVAEKMMIPFFTTKPVGKGTGLGLSISKGIAQDHRGDLVLDTHSAHTRFVFSVSKFLHEDEHALAEVLKSGESA